MRFWACDAISKAPLNASKSLRNWDLWIHCNDHIRFIHSIHLFISGSLAHINTNTVKIKYTHTHKQTNKQTNKKTICVLITSTRNKSTITDRHAVEIWQNLCGNCGCHRMNLIEHSSLKRTNMKTIGFWVCYLKLMINDKKNWRTNKDIHREP